MSGTNPMREHSMHGESNHGLSAHGQSAHAPARHAATDSATVTGHGDGEVEEIVASFAEADEHPDEDVSGYGVEGVICIVFFWAMAMLVFVQFFSRYVMNDSFAWTEELAVYCLIPVVFIGSAMCVKRSRHIHVNFIYRYLPGRAGRLMSTLVDLLSIGFYSYAAWLIANYAMLVGEEPMTTIDWNKSHVYWLAFAGMVMMALRSILVAIRHLRQGYSVLERPEAYE